MADEVDRIFHVLDAESQFKKLHESVAVNLEKYRDHFFGLHTAVVQLLHNKSEILVYHLCTCMHFEGLCFITAVTVWAVTVRFRNLKLPQQLRGFQNAQRPVRLYVANYYLKLCKRTFIPG